MNFKDTTKINLLKKADWELDFYSRPIMEKDGKKRWELLISSTQKLSGGQPFHWEKKCPAGEVNSIWLTKALEEALEEAKRQGWESPSNVRCWRSSMRTMISRAAETIGLEVIASKRTYSLIEWLAEREKDIYPNETGYIAGPIAPTSSPLISQAIPLPEEARGDSLSLASLTINALRDAKEWPIEFNGLLPIKETIDETINIPGIRLFSKNRSLALAAWIGGLEPVKLTLDRNQLILEAGQSDRWLVTDLQEDILMPLKKSFLESKEKADGLQFISIQSKPENETFAGFWMLKDIEIN